MKNKKILIGLVAAAVLAFMPLTFGTSLTPSLARVVTQQVQAESGGGLDKMDDTVSKVDERGIVPCTLSECTFCKLLQMVERIFFWLLSLAFALAVFCVVFSGFAYILSAGDSGLMGWAKEGLKLSLIGFAICLVAWLAIHVLYTVLGYKGNWWQMECSQDSAASAGSHSVANLYINEVPLKDPGGRDNPVALPDLAYQGIGNIPENKYFFIHGLGGQSLDQAANQLAKIAKAAQEQKRVVFAATPYSETDKGTKLTKITNYIANDDKQTLENFANLVLEMAAESPSLEIPLIQTSENGQQQEVAKFNSLWPSNPDFYEGENSIFKTLSEMSKDGVAYKETGPIIINWPEGKVPRNISDFSINLDYDEKTGKYILNIDDPVNVTLPNNISPQAARAAARDFAEVLALLKKRESAYSNQEDFSSQLIALLTKADPSKELTKDGQSKGNDSGYSRDFTQDNKGNVEKTRNWESSGTGLLPSGIATKQPTTTSPIAPVNTGTSAATRNLEKELEKAIKDYVQSNSNSGNGSPTGGKQNNGGCSTCGQNNGQNTSGTPTGSESTTPISPEPLTGTAADPNSMVSQVSIGISSPLSNEERGRIRDMIINIQKEEMDNLVKNKYNPLNIPPEYVLCLIQAESSFNPVATSPTKAAGLGQHTDDSQMEGAQMLGKTAPKHYEEFTKKYGKDLTQLMSTKAMGSQRVKDTLRQDPNLAAAMTYAFVEVKARNILKMNGPVSMDNLRRITYAYVGDGNEGAQWNKIRNCMTNNSWTGGKR
jgi:hypothetical protein